MSLYADERYCTFCRFYRYYFGFSFFEYLKKKFFTLKKFLLTFRREHCIVSKSFFRKLRRRCIAIQSCYSESDVQCLHVNSVSCTFQMGKLFSQLRLVFKSKNIHVYICTHLKPIQKIDDFFRMST